eukprot:scaffold121861_cov72-Phaeocystis_antarctica.AAC.3
MSVSIRALRASTMARSPSASYATPAAPMNAGKDNLATATGDAEGESMPVTEPIIAGCCDIVTSTSEKDGPFPG